MQKNFTLKRIVCLLAALCLAAGLVGCADMPASSSEESSLPTILVGSDVYPPFNYIGEDGAPTGIDVELAKEAFRRMGYRAEFTIIDWERATLTACGAALPSTDGRMTTAGPAPTWPAARWWP